MKKLILSLAGSSLLLLASGSFAAEHTNMDAKWKCTTNVSSGSMFGGSSTSNTSGNASTSNASMSAHKTNTSSDESMGKKTYSAHKAFKYAAKKCGNCTKITCEAQ